MMFLILSLLGQCLDPFSAKTTWSWAIFEKKCHRKMRYCNACRTRLDNNIWKRSLGDGREREPMQPQTSKRPCDMGTILSIRLLQKELAAQWQTKIEPCGSKSIASHPEKKHLSSKAHSQNHNLASEHKHMYNPLDIRASEF